MTETGITWGYARISSLTQHEDRQIKKLKSLDWMNVTLLWIRSLAKLWNVKIISS